MAFAQPVKQLNLKRSWCRPNASPKACLSRDLAIYIDVVFFFFTHIFHETQIFAMATGVSHDTLLHKQLGNLLRGHSPPVLQTQGKRLEEDLGIKMKVWEEQVTVYYIDSRIHFFSATLPFLSSSLFFFFLMGAAVDMTT